ncbi:Bug family tripartite tricarboxylate transporter substrate binding protein [Corticibacter populi]|nr:tripartite tricarboxylate transporter substrate-binding protein [Corticibacter populi]RZS30966.1 tripartite-type tricarboxylate transporter receptor subunit TctC [Corticibacter populi]
MPPATIIPRALRRGLALMATIAGLAILSTPTGAQERPAAAPWPTRPVTLIVPYAAGGNVDVMARWIAPELARRLGQPVVIENISGAGGVIGTQKAVRATADGHTLLLSVESAILIAKMVTPATVPYDGQQDLAPVTLLGSQPLALAGKPALSHLTAGELHADLQAHPGQYSYATTGVGTSLHLAGELLKQSGQIDMVHAPYRMGTQVLTDLAGNQIELAVLPLSMLIEQARAGKLQVFGVLDDKPSPAMPEVAPLGATVPAWQGANARVWTGVFAPRGTPAERIERLDAALQDILTLEDVRQNFAATGVDPEGLGPAAFSAYLAEQAKTYEGIITRGHIRAE